MAFKTFDINTGREYAGFTLYPFFHRSGKMSWASAAVLDMKRVDKLIYLSGQTGRVLRAGPVRRDYLRASRVTQHPRQKKPGTFVPP